MIHKRFNHYGKKDNILAIEEGSERERYDQRLIPKIRLYERVEDKPVVKKQKVEEVPVQLLRLLAVGSSASRKTNRKRSRWKIKPRLLEKRSRCNESGS